MLIIFPKILFRSFCQSYDMKQHSTKVFRDIVNALGSFIQSLFLVPSTGNASVTPNQTGKSLVLALIKNFFFFCNDQISFFLVWYNSLAFIKLVFRSVTLNDFTYVPVSLRGLLTASRVAVLLICICFYKLLGLQLFWGKLWGMYL